MTDETRRFAAGVSLIAVLVAGLYFWSRSRPGSTPPLAPPVAEPAPAAAPRALAAPRIEAPPIASKPAPSAAPRVSPAVVATAPAEPAAPPAARTPFPSDLPRAFTADAFHDELARVVAECKFPYEISEEDCTEFPCIAWGKWKSNMISPDDCPTFHETFGSKDFIFSSHKDAEGNPLVGLSIFPPDFKFGGDEIKHLQARASGMTQTQEHRHIGSTGSGTAELHKASPSKLTGQELAHK